MRRTLLALTVVLADLYLLTGVVQVRRGEMAVVRRFGRVLPHHPGPGLWVGLPWGMDRVDRVVVDRVRTVSVGLGDDAEAAGDDGGAGPVLTGDHNLVVARVLLLYKADPDRLPDFVLQGDRVEGVLARAAESAVAAWAGGRPVDEVLLDGNAALRAALLADVADQIGPYQLGVELLDARVGQLAPPSPVKDDFDAVARAQTGVATLRNRAEQEAAARLNAARADRYRVGEETSAYVRNKKILARQDAERFLARLRRYEAGRRDNPDYLRQVWEEERGRVFARLKAAGGLDLLDHHLGPDGLDLFTAPPAPPRP